MKRNERGLITIATVVAVLAIPVTLIAQDQPQPKGSQPAKTAATVSYNFLIGSGLLCDADDATACPAVARTANEETIEISGAGTLDGRSVTGAGAFTEKTPAGDIVATGVWTATGLVSFESYGLAPGALGFDYPKLRTPFPMAFGKMGGPMAAMMAGPVDVGGLAVIRIRLLPDAGSPRDGILRINCAKGKVPPDEPRDGVRLGIPGGGPEFDEEVSGCALFLLQRPVANFPWRNSAAPSGN